MGNERNSIVKAVLVLLLGTVITALVYREYSIQLDQDRLSEFEALSSNIIIKIQDEFDLERRAIDMLSSAYTLIPELEKKENMHALVDEVIFEDIFFEGISIKQVYKNNLTEKKHMPVSLFSQVQEGVDPDWETVEEENKFLKAYYAMPPLLGGEKIFFRKGGEIIVYRGLIDSRESLKYLVVKINIIEHLLEILYGILPDWLDFHLFYKDAGESYDFLTGKTLSSVRNNYSESIFKKDGYLVFIPGAISLFSGKVSVLMTPSSMDYFQSNNISKVVIGLLGFLLTLFLALWGYSADVRRKVVEQLVESRTSELVKSNNLLVDEQKENHRLLEELKSSQEELNDIANSVEAILFEYDYFDCKFTYVSKKIEDILGIEQTKALAIKNPFRKICHPDDLALLTDAGFKSLSSSESCNVEFRVKNQHGEKGWLRCIATPVFDDDGGIKLNGVLLDITKFKVMSEERSEIESQLRQAQKMEAVGQLAAGIAHEINTPAQFVGDNLHYLKDSFSDINALCERSTKLLNAISQDSELGAKSKEVLEFADEIDIEFLSGDIPESIKQSLDGVKRIAEIVGAMKEFSHPGSKDKETVDINKAIQNTVTVARNEWKYVADVVTDFSEDLPSVPVFPGEFNQVILNMIVNAAHAIGDKYKDEGGKGKITIATQLQDKNILVSISDDGKGMSKEIQDKVFDPFFTTKEVGKGTGQGLSLAFRTIIEGHNGTISVESEEGKGSVFTIKLPMDMV